VFVMTDDLDEQSMQDLPGIREIMGTNGTTFENAYVTYSLCCPSRATILTGQYPHNHDIIGNGLPEGGEEKFRLGPDQSTIATWLDDSGYQTKLVGKYMNSYNDLYVPPGWDEWYAMIGNHWNLSDPATGKINNNGRQTTLGDHSTDVFADKASDFITSSSTNGAPFFLLVGTKAPHSPPEVATRYQNTFTTTPLPRPENFDEVDISDKPQWLRSNYPNRLSQSKISNLQNTYRQRLRSMLSVEELLKKIVTTLDQTDELTNTYIFFTSDNGYHMGNHRLGHNKKTPYEEDIGVPLMVRGPGVPAGEVREQLVLNNDFAPTIADLASATIPKPEEVDGSSFAPLLTNSPPSSWRTAFLEEGWLEGGTTVPTPTHKSVHTQSQMFTEYDTGERELYDLNADPYQLESIKQTHAPQLYSTLQSRLDALRACSGEGCRSAEGFTDAPPPPPTDTDGDGVADAEDNCPAVANADQADTDGDGVGDACEEAPPTVKSTVPISNETGVAPTINVTATFSEEMLVSEDPLVSSINTKTFKLFEQGSTTKLTATVSYSAATDTATLDPTNSLRSGVTYKAVVTTGAKDTVGNPLDQNPNLSGSQQYRWFFTTSP
jgi:N-acetylglucosamine-6-sulfatase